LTTFKRFFFCPDLAVANEEFITELKTRLSAWTVGAVAQQRFRRGCKAEDRCLLGRDVELGLPLPKPPSPNVIWSIDFVSDGLANGRGLRCLTIVDDCARECLAIEVDTSLPGTRVEATLDRLAELRGLPPQVQHFVVIFPRFSAREALRIKRL